MSKANEKLDELVRKERRSSIVQFSLIGLAIAAICTFMLGFAPKSSEEVKVKIEGFVLKEHDEGNSIRIQFRTVDGRLGVANLPKNEFLEVGDFVLCTKFVTYFGTVRYKYLRKSQ